MLRETSRESVHQALADLHRLTSSRRSFTRLMAAAGVELTRTAAEVLAQACRSGPLPMGALATALHLDPGATARIVAGLEDAGLVQRQRSEQDARVNVVRVTPAGAALNARVQQVEAEHLEHALTALSDEELATCATTLVQLVAYLHELEAGGVPRPRSERSAKASPLG